MIYSYNMLRVCSSLFHAWDFYEFVTKKKTACNLYWVASASELLHITSPNHGHG